MSAHGKKPKDGLTSLSRLIPEAYPSSEPADISALGAFGWWSHAVPERVAKNARPVRLQHGVLYVHTTTSAWAQELSFLREQIVAAIRAHAPQAGVTDMRAKVGALPVLPERVQAAAPKALVPLADVPEPIAASLAKVRDDALRDSIGTAARTALAASEADKKVARAKKS